MSHPNRLPSIKDLVNLPPTLSKEENTYTSLSQHRAQGHHRNDPGKLLHPALSLLSPAYAARPSSTTRAPPKYDSHLRRQSLSSTTRDALPSSPGTGPLHISRLPSVSEVLGSMGQPPGQYRSHQASHESPAILDDCVTPTLRRLSSASAYPCDRCGRQFSRKADAMKHVRVVHDRVKNFICSVCGRRFGRKDYCMVS